MTSIQIDLSSDELATAGGDRAAACDLQTLPGWAGRCPENQWTMDADDAFEYGEFAEDAEIRGEAIINESREAVTDRVPLWRLIEMSREDRHLRKQLEDFEDYDDFEGDHGKYAVELSQ